MAGKKIELTGSLQEKSGVYYIAINTYIEGKRKPTWIPTEIPVKTKANEKKANELLAHYIEEYSQNPKYLSPSQQAILAEKTRVQAAVSAKRMLFTEHLKRWLVNKKLGIDIITWESYETYVEAHLLPYFEPLCLAVDEVTPRHIKEYYDYKAANGRKDKKKGGLSYPSLKKHASVLRMAFDEAIILEGLPTNPTYGVPVTKVHQQQEMKQKKHPMLTAEEANRLIAAADGHELKALIFIALYYGLRRSEVMGLRWRAIDLVNDTLEINFTVVRNKSVVEKEKTKTESSMAVFTLLPDVKEVLLMIKKQTSENRKAFGSSYFQSDFVFVKPNGEKYKPDGVYKRFKTLLKKQGLPDMRMHDLRHSCASVLYDKGWDMKAIQAWMRHSTSGMSLYYTKLSKNRQLILADDINNTFHFNDPLTENSQNSTQN